MCSAPGARRCSSRASSATARSRQAFLYGVWADGNRHAGGAYLPTGRCGCRACEFCYDQSIDFVGEGTSAPVIGTRRHGQAADLHRRVTGPVEAMNGDGSVFGR